MNVPPGPATGLPVGTVSELTRLSPRQLRYLAQQGVLRPALRAPAGPGVPALYAPSDIWMLVVVEQVRAVCGAGVPIERLRHVVDALRVGPHAQSGRLVVDVSGCWIQRGSLDRALHRHTAALVLDLDAIAEETRRRLRGAGLAVDDVEATGRGRAFGKFRRSPTR